MKKEIKKPLTKKAKKVVKEEKELPFLVNYQELYESMCKYSDGISVELSKLNNKVSEQQREIMGNSFVCFLWSVASFLLGILFAITFSV